MFRRAAERILLYTRHLEKFAADNPKGMNGRTPEEVRELGLLSVRYVAEIHFDAGEYDVADGIHRRILYTWPDETWHAADLARKLREKRLLYKAVDLLATVTSIDCKTARGYNGRSYAWSVIGNIDRGIENAIERTIEDATKAIELEPSEAIYYRNRARRYILRREFGKASVDYAKALELEPKNTLTLSETGNCYAEIGEYDKAEPYFKQASELSPTDRWLRYNLAILQLVREYRRIPAGC